MERTAWNDIQGAQNAVVIDKVTVVPALGKAVITGDELHLSSAGLISLGHDIATAIINV